MALIPPFVLLGASLPFLWYVPGLTSLSLLAYFAYYYLSALPENHVTQSLPVGPYDDTKEGQPRRHPRFTGGLLIRPSNEVVSLADVLSVSARRYGAERALGSRTTVKFVDRETTVKGADGVEQKKMFKIPHLTDYNWMSYNDIYYQALDAAAGFTSPSSTTSSSSSSSSSSPSSSPLGFGSRIALFANTRSEWLIAFHGCMQVGLTVCTVYASLGADALVFSLGQTEVSHVITEAKLIDTLLKGASRLPYLTTIIYFDDIKPASLEQYKAEFSNLEFIPWNALLERGKQNPLAQRTPAPQRPTQDDLAIIMYTSGSTGNPKGVMLSHGNIIAMTAGVLEQIPQPPNANDTYIAFLPLAHVLELCAESALLLVGGSVGYASPTTLRDEQAYDSITGQGAGDLTKLKPTLMAAVPLILDRLQTGIYDKVNKASPLKQHIFNAAFWLKRRAFLMGAPNGSQLADLVVFNQVKAQFGGRLRYILSGGAPLSSQTQLFINVTLGCPVLQGYGLTETTAGGTICHPDDHEFGKVGGPLPSTELKLIDVPEMGYTHRDVSAATGESTPRGEIAIRGPSIAKGYFKMEEKTEQDFVKGAFDDSPYKWFLTGDIGQLLPDGSFKIIDRKKDLVKLSHGEYIALGNLESVYSASPVVDNIMVYGDSAHQSPIALVVVNHKAIQSIAESVSPSLSSLSIDQLCSNNEVIKAVVVKLNETASKRKLEKWERITGVHLIDQPWTPESGLLTEAMKLKRHEIVKRYKSQLDAIYAASA